MDFAQKETCQVTELILTLR